MEHLEQVVITTTRPSLRMDILRFLAILSRLPNRLLDIVQNLIFNFCVLSVYFNSSVYQFRHPFIFARLSGLSGQLRFNRRLCAE